MTVTSDVADEAVSLVDVSDSEASLTIGQTTYPMRRLKVGDYADAQQHMKDGWLQHVIDKLRITPVDDSVLAKAMADVVSKPVSVLDVLGDAKGESFLLCRALQINGKGPSLDFILKQMPQLDRRIVSKMMMWATGMSRKAEAAGPLSVTTDTGESSTG